MFSMNSPKIHDPKWFLKPDELRAMQRVVQEWLIDLFWGDGNIPQFKPHIQYDEFANRITFLATWESYSEPIGATSKEIWIEMELRKVFPDPIEKARWKSIELDDPLFSKGVFWLRANSKWAHQDTNWIIGFIIQWLEKIPDTRQFSDEEWRSILTEMVKKFEKQKWVSAETVYEYLMNLLKK